MGLVIYFQYSMFRQSSCLSLRLGHLWLAHKLSAQPQILYLRSSLSTYCVNSESITTMATRPTVSVASAEGERLKETIPLPSVFTAPIRPDIVQYVSPLRAIATAHLRQSGTLRHG